MFDKLLNYLGLSRKSSVLNEQELIMLRTENESLRHVVELLEEEIRKLSSNNRILADKLTEIKKAELEAYKQLMEQVDLMYLETLDPIGEA
ncbi:MAG TPA: hypothetical protein DEQ32_13245 [Gammaproteobacteria bacterium]|nr:hypothetical protein [Gammaproteobacteria bacterium]|tara:strand:+ start:1240 stop:1512 length:273 start_codon:yes stop_codon:yes gene_type:complete